MVIVDRLKVTWYNPGSDLQWFARFFRRARARAGDSAIDGSALTAATRLSSSSRWSCRTSIKPDRRTDSHNSSISSSFSSTEVSASPGTLVERLLMVGRCWRRAASQPTLRPDATPFWRTTELSDAGGPARPHCQLTSPARARSSDFVGRHNINTLSKIYRTPPNRAPISNRRVMHLMQGNVSTSRPVSSCRTTGVSDGASSPHLVQRPWYRSRQVWQAKNNGSPSLGSCLDAGRRFFGLIF